MTRFSAHARMENSYPQDVLKAHIFRIKDEEGLDRAALQIFRFQAETNPVYKDYLNNIHIDPLNITDARQIPFLPIELFKHGKVLCERCSPELIFRSSGTTGQQQSVHHVADSSLYRRSILDGFKIAYGDPSGFVFLALLPSYLERNDSSLVYMMQELIRLSGQPTAGFYLNDHEALFRTIEEIKGNGRKIFLVGVTFALLDFSEKYRPDLHGHVVLETGGMKGRRKELLRQEVHALLCDRFNVKHIHSEYGMTELLSQAWSKGEGLFVPPPWMKIEAFDINDPFQRVEQGNSGVLYITDLANLYSCSFIASQDLGRIHPDGKFEVLGRVDNSDVRGCNLMIG